MSYRFTMTEEDHYAYIKRFDDTFVILSLYVDDILLAGNNMEYIMTIKNCLSSNFDMKDMGGSTYNLAIKIYKDRSKKLLSLSEEPYIRKILE